MGRVTAAIDLPYPAERIWAVATRVDLMPRWLPEVVGAELLDATLEPGSRIRLRLSAAAAHAEITGTISELRPPHAFGISGSGGPLGVRVGTSLQPTGPGATRIALELVLTTPSFLGFIAKEAERRIDAELPAALDRFRALVESGEA